MKAVSRERRRGNRSLNFPLGGAVNMAAAQSFGERKCYDPSMATHFEEKIGKK
jgi:hypothetical protein